VDLLFLLFFTSEHSAVKWVSLRAGLLTAWETFGDADVIDGRVGCRAIPDIVEKK
jgi:hypothetical protein